MGSLLLRVSPMIDDATAAEWEQEAPGLFTQTQGRVQKLIAEIRRLREAMLHAQHPLTQAYYGGHGFHAEGDETLCVHCANITLAQQLTAHRAVVRELADMLTRVAGLAAGLDDDDPWFGERRGAKAILDCVAPLLAHPLVQQAREERDAT